MRSARPCWRLWLMALLAFGFPLLAVFLGRASGASAQESEPPATMEEPMAVEPDTADAEESAVVVEGRRARFHCPDKDYCPATDVRNDRYWTGKDTAWALEGQPGVAVQEGGGPEGPWYPSIRGGDPAGVAVYVDGILLNDPLGRPVDVSSLPFPLIDYAVVYRGRAPTEYPVSGDSGLIDLRTGVPNSAPSARGTGWLDSQNNAAGSLELTGPFASGAGLLGFGIKAGPGEFEYIDDRGTPGKSGDDRVADRANNRHLAGGQVVKWERKARGYRVDAGVYHGYREGGVPGESSARTRTATAGQETAIAYAGLKNPGALSPDLDAEVRVHYLHERWWLFDDGGELGAPRHDDHRRSRAGLDSYLDYYGLPGQRLSLYFALYQDEYEPDSLLDPQANSIGASRSSLYLNLAADMALMNGRLKIRPGLRYAWEGNRYRGDTLLALDGRDKSTSSYNHVSSDISASLLLADKLWLLGHTAQYYRTPGFLHESGDHYNIMGNPNLSAETSLNQQIGLLYHPGPFSFVDDLSLELTAYQNLIRDRLGFTEQGGIYYADNLGDARVTGLEMAASINLQDLFILQAAYAFQDAKYLSSPGDGNAIAGVPPNIGRVTVILRQSYGEVYYDFSYQDRRWLDPENDVPAGPRMIHNLGAVYYRGRWSVGIEASNIGNDRNPEILEYPAPGTRYILFMEVKG